MKKELRKERILFLGLLVIGSAIGVIAQTPNNQSPTLPSRELASKARKIVEAYSNLNRFSGSVLVAKDGQVVFAKGYGLSNIELRVPNTTRTRFHIGSLSKQFTAAAILKLESEGRLSTGDPIIKYLPDYPKPQGEIVTIHHLLSHSSGIPSLGQRGGVPDPPNRKNPTSLKELIALFKDLPLQFKPGAKYRYNNSGYILLAAIIEKASGEKFETYLRTRIFEPARMRNTGRLSAEAGSQQVASGYMGYAPEFVKPHFVHPTWFIGADGIYSTVEDLFLWDQALYAERVLPRSQLEKFFKAHVERGRPGRYYAYGWFLDNVHGHQAVNHGGTVEGFVSAYYRFPKERLFIAVLSNYMPRLGIDIPDQIADKVSAAAFGAKYELPPELVNLTERTLRSFAGEYEFETGYRLRIELRNGQLVAKSEGNESWTLATYINQIKLNRTDSQVDKSRRIVQAFIDGDHRTILELAAPARRSEITAEAVDATKNDIAIKWGRLLRITPFAIAKDGSVRNRLTFDKGEMFMLVEFNQQQELVGWFYGNRMMPSNVVLLPISSSKFYIDGFKYDEGAAWGEKPVFVEIQSANGEISGVTIKQGEDEVVGRRIPSPH